MNRTRFYEIIKAHKNGEDISSYVPKNAAEAQLLASLTGGSGSSSGGVEMFNIAELDNTAVGSGQAILDAYNAGMKLVSITNGTNDTNGPTTTVAEVIAIHDNFKGYEGNDSHGVFVILAAFNCPDSAFPEWNYGSNGYEIAMGSFATTPASLVVQAFNR